MHILDEPRPCTEDALRMFVGRYIGGGVGRHVYEYGLNPDWVVKIEYAGGSFQNVLEWETWCEASETKWKKWFAPCLNISTCGQVLVQRKTQPLPDNMIPKSIPSFMTDLQSCNFGVLDGHVVAHDYGLTLALNRGLRAGRMCKVKKDWWSK